MINIGTCKESTQAVLDAVARAVASLQDSMPVRNLVDQLQYAPRSPNSPSDPAYGIPRVHRPALFPHYDDPIGQLSTSAQNLAALHAYQPAAPASHFYTSDDIRIPQGGGLEHKYPPQHGVAAPNGSNNPFTAVQWSGDPDSLELMKTVEHLKRTRLI